MKTRAGVIYVLSALLLAASTISDVTLTYPEYVKSPTYDFSKNRLDAKKIALGRVLFYDPILSADKSTSCASCHSSFNAFAHTDHDLSHGVNDAVGTRNAPPLFNLAWQNEMMWDGAVKHLDMQALAPITHAKEMGESLENVLLKLKENRMYQRLFAEAYADGEITGERMLKALSQFQLTLVSLSSKYDAVKQGLDTFTEQEIKGYDLFQSNCNSCHQEPLFSTYSFKSNGLPIDSTLNDFGKGGLSHLKADSFQFKTPSLRNLSYTYPYMHDGRFSTLNEVLQHYTSGIEENSMPSKELKKPIRLTGNEKADLISFLLTINDKEFVFNADHRFPKKEFKDSNGFKN